VPQVRVLHVAQPLAEGVPRSVGRLVFDQVARGFDVTVACPAASTAAATAAEAGARHVVWEATREPGPSVVSETRSLAAILRSVQPDVLHLHSSKAGLAGRLAARGGTPTIFQPRGWSFEALSGPVRAAAVAWERFAARWAAAIVCVSEGERERGAAAGIRARWRVIANGVDLREHEPATDGDRIRARERLGLGAGPPLVVCVGRLSRQKGQDVLLDAWPDVLRRVPSAHVALVGDGPARDELVQREIPGVSFAGNRSDVGEWLAAADVVALPSRWEGMSLAMLEAMACARSVVASDVSGVRDALGSDAGAVVPVEDAQALADALANRLLDPGRTETEGRAGRARIEASHDIRKTTEAIAKLYLELMPSRPA
jgi:glycosyltransferase involved in cell wall biosynthesis